MLQVETSLMDSDTRYPTAPFLCAALADQLERDLPELLELERQKVRTMTAQI